MYTELLYALGQIVQLDKEEEDLIISHFKPLSLKKGDYFLESGKINRHVGFLKKGLVRYFVYKDDEESTFEFTKDGEFISDYQSFNKKSPSLQNIQAIEACELLIIDYPGLQKIFNETKHGNYLGRMVIEHRFDVMVSQLLDVYMQSHEERYKKFMNHYSDLTQRIPQYLIASYVGVKPPSLSRIRRRFLKELS